MLTSAPYHGANVDGVKYFTTKLDGSSIPDATLKGYLTEGTRTNLLTYSEQFDNAAWTKSNITATANSISSPDGTTTADTLTASSANGTILQTATSTSAAHTLSVWLKRKTGTGNVDLTLDGGTTWTTKTITSSWARYDISQTLANPSSGIRIATSGDKIYAWGAQLEQSSFASSYIPTTTATVTRNADLLTYPGGCRQKGVYMLKRTSIVQVTRALFGKHFRGDCLIIVMQLFVLWTERITPHIPVPDCSQQE